MPVSRRSVAALELEDQQKNKVRQDWGCWRVWAAQATESRVYDFCLGVAVMSNAVTIIMETDVRAAQDDCPTWIQLFNGFLLAAYTVDVIIRVYAFRLEFFSQRLNWLDLFVVGSDVIALALASIIGDVPSFALLRVCRLFRCLKLFSLSRELNMLMSGFAGAMRAMFWAGVMLLIMLTLWSIVAVEYLHPVNLRLVERGVYSDCSRCQRAFASVLDSNLTFLQQIIAGDSWGQVSLPIIEEEPWTSVIFGAILITINLGLMNLVLTAIVDVANQTREDDVHLRLVEKEKEFEQARQTLLALCRELDDNDSGCLTLEELQEGFRSNAEFAATMSTLDVEEKDLDVIFTLLDEDHSGTVSYQEFVDQLHKMKSQDDHTMLVFIKGYVNEIRLKMAEQLSIMREDVSGDCKAMMRALQMLTFGGDHLQKEPSVKVQIEGAMGLECAGGRGVPYCICEVQGKPASKVQTPAATEPQDPKWNFEDSILGYVPGDALTFSVWDQSLDELLGRAVLTSDQMVEGCGVFDGELALDDSPAEAACLRVKVGNLDAGKEDHGSVFHARDLNSHSLISIGADIERLSQQVAGELAQLKQHMLTQLSEHASLLQEQLSPLSWPACAKQELQPQAPQEDDPPLCPAKAGEEVTPLSSPPRCGSPGRREGCREGPQAPDSCAVGTGVRTAASGVPLPSPMSRV